MFISCLDENFSSASCLKFSNSPFREAQFREPSFLFFDPPPPVNYWQSYWLTSHGQRYSHPFVDKFPGTEIEMGLTRGVNLLTCRTIVWISLWRGSSFPFAHTYENERIRQTHFANIQEYALLCVCVQCGVFPSFIFITIKRMNYCCRASGSSRSSRSSSR